MSSQDWAAKVLEGVPRHGFVAEYGTMEKQKNGYWLHVDDTLAAIARMGAGDEELQFPDGWRERAHSFKGILKLQAAWADGFNAARDLAAAHIAALTAQNREMALDVLASSGQAAEAYAAQTAAEAEAAALRARVARLEGALQRISNEYSVKWQAGQWSRAALTDGGKDGLV